jgi:hypothetical protein
LEDEDGSGYALGVAGLGSAYPAQAVVSAGTQPAAVFISKGGGPDVELMQGGLKFPDGTVQVTAGGGGSGYTGYTGYTGDTGYTGYTGDTGYTGYTGPGSGMGSLGSIPALQTSGATHLWPLALPYGNSADLGSSPAPITQSGGTIGSTGSIVPYVGGTTAAVLTNNGWLAGSSGVSSTYSVSLWAMLGQAPTGNDALFGISNVVPGGVPSTYEPLLIIGSTGCLYVSVWTDSGIEKNIETSAGTWDWTVPHHVVLSLSDNAGNTTASLYVDGALDTTWDMTGDRFGTAYTTIGAADVFGWAVPDTSGGWTYAPDGLAVQDFATWEGVALTASQAQQLYLSATVGGESYTGYTGYTGPNTGFTGYTGCTGPTGPGSNVNPAFIGSSFNAFGDSITYGSESSEAYPSVIATLTGMTASNYALSGTQAADIDTIVYGQPVTASSVSMVMIGTNDQWHSGINYLKLADFRSTLLAELAYLAIPDAQKYWADSPSMTLAGTWFQGIGAYPHSMTTTTAESTASFVLNGTAIYIAVIVEDSQTGQFSLTVDGNSYGTINCYGQAAISTNLGKSYTTCLTRVAGLLDIPHSVVLTFIGGSYGNLAWVAGSGGVNAATGPLVYSLSIPLMGAAGYSSLGGSIANSAAYNGAIQTCARTLASDGLDVAFVDVTPYLNQTTDLNVDGLHPTTGGQAKIANAAVVVMNDNLYPRDRSGCLAAKGTAYDADGDPIIVNSMLGDGVVFGENVPVTDGQLTPALSPVPANMVLAGPVIAPTPIAYYWGMDYDFNLTTVHTQAFNVPAGSLVVCVVYQDPSFSTVVPTLGDTAGNDYVQIGSPITLGPISTFTLFYAKDALPNAANVIAATWATGPACYGLAFAVAMTQMDATDPLDVVASAYNGVYGQPATCQPFSTAYPHEVALMFSARANPYGYSSGFTANTSSTTYTSMAYDEYTGYQIDATASETSSGVPSIMVLATFKALPLSPPRYRRLDAADIPGGSGSTGYTGYTGPTPSSSLGRSASISIGDGVNAIPANTYVLDFQCKNDTGATITITGISFATDNAGTSTADVQIGSSGPDLLNSPIEGTTGTWVVGSQSGTTTITAGQWLKATFVADGTTKLMTLDLAGTL